MGIKSEDLNNVLGKLNKMYQINVVCSNCGYHRGTPIIIPKGIYWEEYFDGENFECEYCGCKKCLNRSC